MRFPQISAVGVVVVLLFAAGLPAQAAPDTVTILRRADAAEPLQFGVHELESALRAAAGFSPRPCKIMVESLDQPALDPQQAKQERAVPKAAEAFAIRRRGDDILVLGRDAVGAMYGAMELAEIVRRGGTLTEVTDTEQQPYLAFRAVNQFLFEEALKDPGSWFYQEEFWQGYMAQLARSRHNVLDLHGGYGLVETNFPNIYPYFVHLDEFPDQSVGKAAAARNLGMLNHIIEIGRRYGVNVALMNYTVQGRKNEAKDEWFGGFDSARLEKYTYQASRALLEGCSNLWMYGFRIGESGQPEDFFQKTYLAAIADSGFRGKLFTRSWLATRGNIETIQRGYPGDFYIEVKYNGEQLGLPYQAITSPTNFDPSYSYQGYANLPRGFKLVYQVRANGTTRLFHWGDPDYVARIVRSCRELGDAAGYSVEPMSAYYPMTDKYHRPGVHQYFKWTWQRDWFWYELWGRLAYDPTVKPEVFKAMFVQRFGSAGALLYPLVTASSRIVPLIMSAITLGPDHRQWAPEFETGNPDFTDRNGRKSFGNIAGALDVSALDPTVMTSMADAAAAEIADAPDGRVTPRATAVRLFSLANRIDDLIARLPAASANAEEADCLRLDAQALAALARFAGERYLAGLNLAQYQLASYPPSLASARHHLSWAREHWRRLAAVADGHYAPVLDTLRMYSQAYRWESQLAVIDGDLAYLAELDRVRDSRRPADDVPRLTHLPGAGLEQGWTLPGDAALPVQWRGSGFENLRVDGHEALRSHGGTIAYDVNDLMFSNEDIAVALDVSYWDPGPGTKRRLVLAYDGAAQPGASMTEAGVIELGGTRGWREARLTLERARFAGSGPGNTDITVTSSDGGEFVMQVPDVQSIGTRSPHLDLHIVGALKQAPVNPSIHWRQPGEAWQVAPLRPGIGEFGVEGGSVPRGREVYRFDVPSGTEAIDYYFSAELGRVAHRLPAGTGYFQWKRRVESDPPVVAIIPAAPTDPLRAGPLVIRARVTDPSGVAKAVLRYKPIPSQKEWSSTEMREEKDGIYAASVPLTEDGLLYGFTVWDKLGNAANYPDFQVETPYRVIAPWDGVMPGNGAIK